MRLPGRHLLLYALALVCALASAACGGGNGFGKPQPEYEEELYLALDGTATLNVNASVASLVALRGLDLNADPRARLDRERLRQMFAGPGARVTSVSLSRRKGRRYVHVGIDVDDVRKLPSLGPFAWSRYRFERRTDAVEFGQTLGAAAARPVGNVGWTGDEIVSFRLHIPSEITFHNTTGVDRGNILEWDQPLADRLRGEPLELQVQMESKSILYSTLLLFGATIVAAALAFAIVIYLIVRKGRAVERRGPQ